MKKLIFHWGGRIPISVYKIIRCHVAVILEQIESPCMSHSSVATRLGVSYPAYLRARRFVAKHKELVLAAQASGDWTKVEETLFQGAPQFRFYPSYKKALVAVGAASKVPKDSPPPSKVRRKTSVPKKEKRRTISWIRRICRALGRLVKLVEPGES